MLRCFVVLFTFHYSLFISLMNAQSPAYRHFTDEDGLPSMTVYDIKQDKKGYLWMNTTKGICRFDGQEFKKYEVPDLKGQDIPYFFMDDEGIPWFYNMAGEIILIRNDSIFKIPIKGPMPQMSIISFYVYNKKIYITWRFSTRIETISYDVYNFSPATISKRSYGILGVYNGILLGNNLEIRDNRFQVYDILNNKLHLDYQLHSNDNFNYHAELNILSEITKDSIVLITPYFSGLINSKFQVLGSYKFRDILKDSVLYVSLINQGELFIKTNLNSYIYDLKTNQYRVESQFGTAINTIFEDRNKRKWISTTNKGLYLSMNNKVDCFFNTNSGIVSNEIIRLLDDFPNLIITHDNGAISIYNQVTKSWNTIQIQGSRRIISILKYKNNEYFIGSDNGLYVLKVDNELKYSVEFIKLSCIKDVLLHDNNGVFILTNSGTYLCNSTELYNNNYKLIIENALIKTRSTCINKYNDTVLAGTINGIHYYNGIDFIKWNNLTGQDLYINKLYNQQDSILWICTDGNGVYAYKDGSIIDSLNTSNGLPSNSVSCITTIDNDRMMFGTDNGAYVYDIRKRKGFGFNQLDGLPGKEIIDICYSNAIVWIGTAKGLASVPIDQLQPNQEKPFITISSAMAFTNGGEIKFSNELPYHSNHLRFVLQTRSLLSENQLKILYKLNDTDSTWITANSKILEFVGLAPGKYNLQIKAINEDGVSSEKTVNLAFVINPPWWKTLWFNMLVICSLVSASISITYWRQRKRRKEEDKKRLIVEQMNQLRQQALQNQMNPHFIFNSLNAIQNFLLVNDEVNAVNYMSKFGKLIRMIFEQSKMKFISLEEEIDLLKHYIHLEELRFGNKVEVTFKIDPDLIANASEITIPPLLIQPIIENSFRHGLFHLEKHGFLSINMFKQENDIICIIEDNGIGRDRSKKINEWKNKSHKSSGIKSTFERLEILDNGRNKLGLEIIDLIDHSGKPAGTKAILKL